MKTEQHVLNEERNVVLTAYLSDETDNGDGTVPAGTGKLPAILVIPGGGYRVFADIEAEAPALAYRAAGFQAFTLQYTLGEQCRWPLPLEDYEQAMALLLENAEAWRIDPDRIAVAGFSAGGHLAACAITVAEHRPAAAILVYPVILPEAVDSCLPGAPRPSEHVTAETCPCFLIAARDDDAVDIRSTLAMGQALADHNVPFETHIYSKGGHAFSVGEFSPRGSELTPRLKHWVPESIGWLEETLGH